MGARWRRRYCIGWRMPMSRRHRGIRGIRCYNSGLWRCIMLDMLIQGGRVVTPAGVGNWDVGIMGEQIVAVAFPGILPGEAKHVINARGKIVVPGGIETHAH